MPKSKRKTRTIKRKTTKRKTIKRKTTKRKTTKGVYCKYCDCWHKKQTKRKQKGGETYEQNELKKKVDLFIEILNKWSGMVINKLKQKKSMFEAAEIADFKKELNILKTNILTKLSQERFVNDKNLAEYFIKITDPLRDELYITDLAVLPALREAIYNEFWPDRYKLYENTLFDPNKPKNSK